MHDSAQAVCSRCSYNLHGLPLDSRCPECGTAIALSLRGDLLRDADRDWLQRVRFGLLLRIVVTLFMVPILTASWAGLWSAPPHVLGTVVLAASFVGLLATFSITAPEPHRSEAEAAFSVRLVVRYSAVPAFLGEQVIYWPQLSH